MKTLCPNCNQKYSIEDKYFNTIVKCKVCAEEFVVEPMEELAPLKDGNPDADSEFIYDEIINTQEYKRTPWSLIFLAAGGIGFLFLLYFTTLLIYNRTNGMSGSLDEEYTYIYVASGFTFFCLTMSKFTDFACELLHNSRLSLAELEKIRKVLTKLPKARSNKSK